MTLEQFWSILLQQWRLVLLCFLSVGLGSFMGSQLMQPVYQSSALVQVEIHSTKNKNLDYTVLMTSNQLVPTEATLATSALVLRQVAHHYPDLTISQIAREVSASPKINTQLFEIDVVDPSPTRAASLANDIAAVLIQGEQQQIQQMHQNIDHISQQVNNTTTKISALRAKGGDQGQSAVLLTQLIGLQQSLTQWQTALSQLELTRAQSGNPLKIAQRAQPATSPVWPNVPLNMGSGLLVGLLLGLLLALQYEKLAIRTPEAIIKQLEWPVLATIWRAKVANPQEMISPISQDANVEGYHALLRNIGFLGTNKALRSMLITSPSPRDGKSSIAANLAIFMAKAGKSTLLIDSNWHHPTQHLLFGLPSTKSGLSNAIQALSLPDELKAPVPYQSFAHPSDAVEDKTTSGSLEPFVHPVEGIPNLRVMPSGPLPSNPAELLASEAMQRFLTLITDSKVETVIFDISPLSGLSDASALASKVDGVLVVVDTTRATRGKLKQVRAILSQTGIQVLGCVANKVRHKRQDDIYPSYYSIDDESSGEQSTNSEHTDPATPNLTESSSAKVN